MNRLRFWLRWSWRDLRERWLQVAAIALIIALGTGVYAGLGNSAPWRYASYDDSYALLNMYNLRVRFTEGNYVAENDLQAALASIDHAGWIKAIEPRLLTSTLVDVSTPDDDIVVPGLIMGVDVADEGPHVNGIYLNDGRMLNEADAGQNRAILENHFAAYYDLPAQGTLHIGGGVSVEYVGLGMTPEYFTVISNRIGFNDEANYAVLMVPLETAQTLAGHPGAVNDLVLTLTEDADLATVQNEIETAIHHDLSGTGFSFMEPEDDEAYNMLYGDIDSDDQMFMLMAYLFLAGAAFGTFNLATRIVESQRRQIGIGMALGTPPTLLAVRPLLVGIQIALLGVIFGMGIGWLVGEAFAALLIDVMPMPVFEAPFLIDVFAEAALLGILLPLVATIYPVWRAVRVPPVDAIKTGYLVAKGSGLAPLLAQTPLPGRSFTQMPLRNVLRAPRRTLLTLLGVAMAITTLIAVIGMFDSFLATIDDGENEFLQDNPDRMVVALNSFYPVESEQVQAIQAAPEVAEAAPGINLNGNLIHNGENIEVFIELVDMDNALWTPTVEAGAIQPGAAGILIGQKAADDLGVKVGDTITLNHPQREGLLAYRMIETEVEVAGIHGSPLRFLTYMDISQAEMMGLDGLANMLYVAPAAGASEGDVQRALFQESGVASVKAIAALTQVFRDLMDLFVGFMSIVVIAVLALAFLIAFNSTSINVDERAREIATMFAFGLPIRTVTRMTMIENLVTGVMGTLAGLGMGYLALMWMMNSRVTEMMPDVGMTITVYNRSLLLAVMLGVVVVALTPLLSMRKMSRMDLPSTLRVME